MARLSPRGIDRYKGIVKNHLIPALGHIQLSKLNLRQIQNYYNADSESYAPSTIRYHHAVLHKALDTAITWQLLNRNPSHAAIIPPKHQPQFQIWVEEEIKKFLETAETSPFYMLFLLALATGMRRSELLALRWRDIEIVPGRINISRSLHQTKSKGYVITDTKSKSSRRTITLPSSATKVLESFKTDTVSTLLLAGYTFSDDRLVFCHADSKPLSPNSVTRSWNSLTQKAGVKKIRLHDARHTHASILLKAGVHLKVVQERLGHSSIQITADLYSHLMPGIQESAAEKFDKFITG
jgi:integrase